MDNGFIPFEPNLVFVALDGEPASLQIDTDAIVDISAITFDLTKVSYKENDIIKTVTIKENVDYFKGRVYIF